MVKRFKWGLMGQPRRSKDSSVDSNADQFEKCPRERLLVSGLYVIFLD